MIQKTDLLNINFYKKECFTGSCRGMRYLIKKAAADSADGESSDLLHATVWPGPYNYESTADDQKKTAQFPFSEEGLRAAADWLNAEWTSRKDDWPETDRGYTVYE